LRALSREEEGLLRRVVGGGAHGDRAGRSNASASGPAHHTKTRFIVSILYRFVIAPSLHREDTATLS
jgi:hypothetical protein